MTRIIEDQFLSPADGLPISVMAVLPEKQPYRAVVQLVHGMSEHRERYLPFMEFLAQRGYAAVIHDHRGHGKSVRDKKDLGYMYGGGASALLQDIQKLNEMLRERLEGLPVILFGHSMGSLAARAYAAKHDDTIDMLILCGSPSNNAARPLGVVIARIEQLFLGSRHKSRLLEMMAFGNCAARFRKDKSCTAWICSDPDVAEEYKQSELCGFTFTDDAYLVLFELMKRAYDKKHWKCTNPQLPVLFVGGADDPCIGNVRRFASALRCMRQAGYRDVKGKLYPGMRHEILNEKQKARVYRDIAAYMNKKGI